MTWRAFAFSSERLDAEWQTSSLAAEGCPTLGIHVLLDPVPVLFRHAEALVEVTYRIKSILLRNEIEERHQRERPTSDSVDEERVELLLAVFAETRQVGGGLRFAVEQVVEQSERHLFGSATVRVDVKQVT